MKRGQVIKFKPNKNGADNSTSDKNSRVIDFDKQKAKLLERKSTQIQNLKKDLDNFSPVISVVGQYEPVIKAQIEDTTTHYSQRLARRYEHLTYEEIHKVAKEHFENIFFRAIRREKNNLTARLRYKLKHEDLSYEFAQSNYEYILGRVEPILEILNLPKLSKSERRELFSKKVDMVSYLVYTFPISFIAKIESYIDRKVIRAQDIENIIFNMPQNFPSKRLIRDLRNADFNIKYVRGISPIIRNICKIILGRGVGTRRQIEEKAEKLGFLLTFMLLKDPIDVTGNPVARKAKLEADTLLSETSRF